MSDKIYDCQHSCGTKIHFENSIKSSSGKQIPLEPDGKPHQCPKKPNPWNGNKKPTQVLINQEINNNDISVEVLLKRLESVGVKLDLNKLRNMK
jgi:hypothetical protein